ncbi:MAG: FtsQ-type POTRA domain-containing protein [Terracoccus sp.]
MMITRMLTRDPKHDTDQGLSSARARFEKRAAAARRRPRVIASVAVALLLLVGLVAWLGWFSPVFTADTVVVQGASKAQSAQVRRVAAVPLGGPVLRVDTDAVTGRLQADREWADIVVERSLPHTVTITVRPRSAALAVRTSAGTVEVVDGDGFVIRSVDAPPKGVPLVTAGTTVVTSAGVTAALQALSALDPTLRKTVSGVTVSAADQVKFTLTVKGARKTVVWGGPGDAATKARLVTILAGQPGSTVDVSVPSSPVTR